jgi:hypothetical protein
MSRRRLSEHPLKAKLTSIDSTSGSDRLMVHFALYFDEPGVTGKKIPAGNLTVDMAYFKEIGVEPIIDSVWNLTPESEC